MPLRSAAFGGEAKEGDIEIQEVRLIGSNKVLEKQLSGPGYHVQAEDRDVGSRIHGI